MNNRNKIWLSKENDENVITHGKVVVTDKKRFDELSTELKDISSYVLVGTDYLPKCSGDFIKYTSMGAVRYKNFGESDEYMSSHFEYHYRNPRAESFQLMVGDVDSGFDLLDLFATLECGNNREKQIEEFNRARTIISQLESSSLDIETLNLMIKQMWPNFGFYATEALRCTDIEIGKSYNIDELNAMVESSEKLGLRVSNDVKVILSKTELAKSNSRVLSLARRAHRMVNPSK